jgi:hypothetical protein
LKILLQYDLLAIVRVSKAENSFPIDWLNVNRWYADLFSQVLETVADRTARSRACLTIVPFVSDHAPANWMPSPRERTDLFARRSNRSKTGTSSAVRGSRKSWTRWSIF